MVLSILIASPLTARLLTDLPGTATDHDVISFVWNLWWTRHALIDLGQSPFTTEMVFAPFRIDLRLHTYSLLHGLVSIPLQSVFGVIGAFNLVVIATLAGNAYTTFLLARAVARDLTGMPWPLAPALIAATTACLSPSILFHLRVGRPSFGSIWPIALALLFVIRLSEGRGWRYAVGLGVSLIAAMLLDYQILLFGMAWVAIVAVAALCFSPRWRTVSRGSLLMRIAVGVAIAGVPFAALFLPALLGAEAAGYPVPTAEDTRGYSLRVQDFLSPWFLRATFGVVLTLSTVTVALVALLRREWNFWLVGAVVFLLLSLGVVLQPTELPLPFAFLRELPGLGQFRTPYRFAIPASLGLALATGVTLAEWWDGPFVRILRRSFALMVMVMAVIDALIVSPFAAQQPASVGAYSQIAASSHEGLVLEVPLGVRSGTDQFGQGETLQFYQMVHGRPIINAMIARVPRKVFDYYRASPALRLLTGEPVDVSDDEVDRDFAKQLNTLGAAFVVVHFDMLTGESRTRILAALDRQPALELVDETGSVRLYEVARYTGS